MAPISESEFVILGGYKRAGKNNDGEGSIIDIESKRLTTIIDTKGEFEFIA